MKKTGTTLQEMATVGCEDCYFIRERPEPIEIARDTAAYHSMKTGHVTFIKGAS